MYTFKSSENEYLNLNDKGGVVCGEFSVYDSIWIIKNLSIIHFCSRTSITLNEPIDTKKDKVDIRTPDGYLCTNNSNIYYSLVSDMHWTMTVIQLPDTYMSLTLKETPVHAKNPVNYKSVRFIFDYTKLKCPRYIYLLLRLLPYKFSHGTIINPNLEQSKTGISYKNVMLLSACTISSHNYCYSVEENNIKKILDQEYPLIIVSGIVPEQKWYNNHYTKVLEGYVWLWLITFSRQLGNQKGVFRISFDLFNTTTTQDFTHKMFLLQVLNNICESRELPKNIIFIEIYQADDISFFNKTISNKIMKCNGSILTPPINKYYVGIFNPWSGKVWIGGSVGTNNIEMLLNNNTDLGYTQTPSRNEEISKILD